MAAKTEVQERVDPETGEVLTSKEISISQQAASGVVVGGKAYKIVKRVNLPTLKHESGEVVCVRIDDPIRLEKNIVRETVKVAGVDTDIEREVELNVVRVTELTSGQPFEYVCNAMTADNLRGAYQDNSYVGKSFAIQKLGTVAGKRYKETNVVEIEPN